jgi:hypothetical protein
VAGLGAQARELSEDVAGVELEVDLPTVRAPEPV